MILGRSDLAFIAHFLHFSHAEMMEMEMIELAEWYKEGLKLHNKLNQTE